MLCFVITRPELMVMGGFSLDQQTLLIFVIRDHLGTAPSLNPWHSLEIDLLRIWDSLSRSSKVANAQPEDYFDLVFTRLPHQSLAADAFESKVQNLTKKFTDKMNEGYYSKSGYRR